MKKFSTTKQLNAKAKRVKQLERAIDKLQSEVDKIERGISREADKAEDRYLTIESRPGDLPKKLAEEQKQLGIFLDRVAHIFNV